MESAFEFYNTGDNEKKTQKATKKRKLNTKSEENNKKSKINKKIVKKIDSVKESSPVNKIKKEKKKKISLDPNRSDFDLAYDIKMKELQKNIFKNTNLLFPSSSVNDEPKEKVKKNKINKKTTTTTTTTDENAANLQKTNLKKKPNKITKRKLQNQSITNVNGSPLMNSTPNISRPRKQFIKRSEMENLTSPIANGTLIQKNPNQSLNVSNTIHNLSQLSGAMSGNSIKEGEKHFQWIIHPIEVDTFFKDSWEKRPFLVKRGDLEYYSKLISTSTIDSILRENNMHYGKNVDVTVYKDGERQTLNPAGRAHAPVVWDFYRNGCSVRLLNPQTFIPRLALLNANLQEFFGCFVGANAYLTPPNSQGFAPHFDDIEAFVLQIEGSKHWKVYSPRNEDEILPRHSSGNFSDDDDLGEPIIDVTLTPGQLLYFPRGFIHQARSLPDVHSLHITLSCYQLNSWADLMEKMLPVALSRAIEAERSLREGLPINYLTYMGLVHQDKSDSQREAFVEKVHSILDLVKQHLPIDCSVDQMGKQFVHSALPPVLSKNEKHKTVFEGGERMTKDGKIENQDEITTDSKIKLIRAHVLRLVMEDDTIIICYNVDNTLEYQEIEQQFFEIKSDIAPAIECLVTEYPNYVSISDLPLESEEDKNWIATQLWERGLVMTE